MSASTPSRFHRLLAHRAHPLAMQVPATLLLGVVLAALFLGPEQDEFNAGSYLLWYVWWPLLPFSFLLWGRLWCAYCPVTFFYDRLEALKLRRLRSPKWLLGGGVGLAVSMFLLAHLFNLKFSFEENIPSGRVFAIALVSLAFVTALLFTERLWCRALCPVGGLGAALSGLALFRVGNIAAPCGNRCHEPDAAVCPMGMDACRAIDFQRCICCGDCIRECKAGNIRAVPSREMKPESGAPSYAATLSTFVIAGVAMDIGVAHLTGWPILFWKATSAVGATPSAGLEMILHILIIASPGLLAAVLALWGKGSHGERLGNLGRPALLMGAATLLALALRPLLLGGPMNLKAILMSLEFEQASLLGMFHHMDGTPLRILQMGVLTSGAVWALRHIVQSVKPGAAVTGSSWMDRLAGSVFLVGLYGTLMWMFSKPMLN